MKYTRHTAVLIGGMLSACGSDFAGVGVGSSETTFRGGGDSNAAYDSYFLTQEVDPFTDNFTQGEGEATNNDVFIQGEKFGALDIALVVDNSTSMEEEQKELSNKLQPLLSEVGSSDWRIGITSTEAGAPCRDLITRTTPNQNSKFKDAVDENLGVDGTGDEVGFYKARHALSSPCAGQKWVRDNSTIAVLIVSDADNCSTGNPYDCAGTNSLSTNYLLDYLNTQREVGVDAKIYGIISRPVPGSSGKECSDAEATGNLYQEAIEAAGGISGSICADSYTNILKDISKNIANVLNAQFNFKRRANKDSILVTINGKKIPPNQYKVTKRGVTFKKPPSKGAQISIKYLAENGALSNSFHLSNFATNNGISVYVNGELLEEGSYHIDEVNQKIVFDQEPELGAEIVVEYNPAEDSIKKYKIDKGLKSNSMSVLVNNSRVAFKYDSVSGVITLETPPPVGAKIEVRVPRTA